MDYNFLYKKLCDSVKDPFWNCFLTNKPHRIHLAILCEPYLSLLISGEKRIESRFSKNKICPYGSVFINDVILLKKTSGPVMAVTLVSHVEYFDLSKYNIDHIIRNYSSFILPQDDSFWAKRQYANYATLIQCSSTTEILNFEAKKRDRRAWISFTHKTQSRNIHNLLY